VLTQPRSPQSFAEDSNDFALAMYERLRQRPGNLFFSPFGIRTAIGMAEAGAKGETASQMRDALRISSSDEALHVDFAKISQRLNAAGAGNTRWRWQTRYGVRMARRSSPDSSM
jgi:serpin B